MQITIEPRFQGIEGMAQGGHLAGLISQMSGRELTVRFRRPCPLGRTLDLIEADGVVRLMDGDLVVLEGWTADPVADPPPPVSLDAAQDGRRWAESQAFAQRITTCFSCGDSAHSFGVHAGRIEGTDLAATPFSYPEWTAPEGLVESRFLWAPIDCAAGWRVTLGDTGRPAVTGELRVQVHERPRPGETLIAGATADEWTGRTRRARSGIYRPDGQLLAASESVWVAVG
ncbi:MAG: hypothetical protein R3246_04300 [Acidimicrobiia bacterium]|nr:hypothetical protein [Acidimicrobiia bacterium]